MWQFIEDAHKKLSDEDKVRLKEEAGLTGDRASTVIKGHFAIASYLVEDSKRFTYFADRDLNSHHESVPSYLRMYRVFEPMRATLHNRSLNVDELMS